MEARRQDLHHTSTGVGHDYRPGYYFPSSNYQPVLNEPMPPSLAKQDEITNTRRFETTTGHFHDKKYLDGVYSNPIHKKAPGHWKVGYVKDHIEKLGKGSWRKPLTMGNQKTEQQDQFDNKRGLNVGTQEFTPNPQPFNLLNHHNEGPSKKMVPSTLNEKIKGMVFYPKDKGVLRLDDTYLTTTNKDHRAFSRHELDGYPRKDATTYWECEEYPKAWGHGQKHNPVPKDTVPRENLPMRDPTWFKFKTKIPRQPNAMLPVPHSGLKSLQQDSYVTPSDVKLRDIFFCPVDTPYVLPEPGPKSTFTAPKMYKTEYNHIGGEEVVIV
ncbi:uncharacterized protein LOC106173086 [Lingula anatina]|uniref:Uncharacterized protein LOC106173086 n=1 Tax=Lingula anatina TaxID=7574 RepID=A0A1S3JI02_LINAN|nr:uncharacterized protein LOC106173086 [Lingula anatina]|eukprot:XP_013409529.1 uncharacterized protein LOC106173086 [Lingula anatina]